MAQISAQHQTEIQRLVCAAQSGQREAFDELLRRFEKFVLRIAFSRLRNFHDAEDTAQNVFIEAYLHLQRLQDPAKFTPWLRRLTLNLCADRLRRRPLVSADTDAMSHCATDAPATANNDRESVTVAIKALSNPLRETMELYYLQNCPLKEISERLGAPMGTIKRRLHEARRRLRNGGHRESE